MIPALIYLILFLFGYVIIHAINDEISFGEKAGISLPLSFGTTTVFMVLLNILGISISLASILMMNLLLVAIIIFILYKKQKLSILLTLPKISIKKLLDFNLAWIILTGAVLYLIIGITIKSAYWPTTAYDSVTGYDYMAKVLAAEGRFDNSIFDPSNPTASIRHSYPPYVSGTFSIPYMMGSPSSKIAIVLLFLSMVIYFWSLFRKHSSETASMFFLLLMVATPEFLAMAGLSLTNVPQSLFASSGLIALAIYSKNENFKYLIFGTIMLGINVWSRSDGIIFIAGGGVMLLYSIFYKKKGKLKDLVIYSFGSGFFFVLWQLFSHLKIENIYSNTDAFVKHLFWDSDKFSKVANLCWNIMTNTQLFGYIFFIFLFVLLLNIKFIIQDRPTLLFGLFTSLIFYSFLYYQMDNGGENFGYSLESMIGSSYKRGLFPFLPIICFYMASSPMVKKIFSYLYKPLFTSKAKG